jgi:putative FmdB family regulatory protein
MPTYEYRCAKCGQHVEAFQSFSDAPLTKHKGCGGKLTKVLSPAGIVLKGSGFYKTDNRGSRSSSTTSPEKAEKSPESDSGSSGSDGSSGASSKSSDSGAKSSDAKSA